MGIAARPCYSLRVSDDPQMISSAAKEGLLTGSYSLVRRSGILSTSFGRGSFRSAYFLYKRYIEDHLSELLKAHPDLLRGGNVLDVGANIGYTAAVLGKAVDPGYRVFAFEPEPFNYGMLQSTAAQPDLKAKVVTVQAAVGAEDGTVELWQNLRHHADHRVITDSFRSELAGAGGISVPLVTVDRFLENHPGPVSFVKIDVQGFELAVCQGMSATLDKNSELSIVLEYAPASMRQLGFDPLQLIQFLTVRGFRPYHIRPKGVLSEGIPSALEGAEYADLLFSRRPMTLGEGR